MRDWYSMDQLHDEVRPAGRRGPGVENSGDVDMIHHCQGLPLGLEAGDYLARVHAWLNDLEGHAALDRLQLLGHINHSHPSFTNLLEELVRPNLSAELFVGLVDRGAIVNREGR